MIVRSTLSCIVTLLALSGCGSEEDPTAGSTAEPTITGTEAGADIDISVDAYADWRPIYHDVRSATIADIESIQARTLERAHLEVQLDELEAGVAVTPEHVRVRLAGIELHMRPSTRVLTRQRPVVVCQDTEPVCVRVPENADTDGGPHLFGGFFDGMVFTMFQLVASQLITPEFDVADTSYAHLDSPLGPLDCLITGGSDAQRAGLEGEPLDPSPELVFQDNKPPLTPFCMDARGIVLIPGSAFLPIIPVTASRTPSGTTSRPTPNRSSTMATRYQPQRPPLNQARRPAPTW